MNDFIKNNIEKLLNCVQPGYSDIEIKEFEIKNSLAFPDDYREFLKNSSSCNCESAGTFQLEDGLLAFGMGSFFSFDNYGSWIGDMIENGEILEDIDLLYNFGSDACNEGQRLFIGVKEPLIGKIYLLNWREGDGDVPVKNYNGMFVYPKHFVADSFDEFLEILIDNLDNPRIGE